MKQPPRLVGLTGRNGAGKGEAAAFLRSRGYAYFSLSDILRDELAARGEPPSRDNLIRVGNELRTRFGPDILARRTLAKVKGPAVIDSIRNPREVEFFRAQGGFILLAVEAPLQVRYERSRARGRDESASTLEEFRRKEEEELRGGETGQQLLACLAMADLTVTNDATLEDFRRKLQEVL